MERVACDLCQAGETREVYAGSAWKQPIPAGLALVRCRECGLMYLNPRPSPVAISEYYPPEYGAYRAAIEDENWAPMRYMRRRKMVGRRRLVERSTGLRGGRILDVGCATGLFLHEMALAGWQALGVDLSSEAAAYARRRFGLDVHCGTLFDIAVPAEKFDVVTYWDVLEHTYSPRSELARLAGFLRPGGMLVVNVPNWDSIERRVFGPHWIGLDPPRHLYVFTRATLGRLLAEAGFGVLGWQCVIPSYFSASISLVRWLGSRSPRLAQGIGSVLNVPGMRLAFAPSLAVIEKAGLGGTIAVLARKTGG